MSVPGGSEIPNCYQCDIGEGVFYWNIGSTKLVVPLCQPCRKKIGRRFMVIEEALLGRETPASGAWCIPLSLGMIAAALASVAALVAIFR